jgi:predicted PhzF superfamily epimerase YddE/YHI9
LKAIPLYQVDAFTTGPFTGNPAAVCVIDGWLPGDLMQKIAMENNLAETAFIVRQGDEWLIRWFTPVTEVDLCGHATLASSFVVLNLIEPERDEVTFRSMHMGDLIVRKNADLLELDFPADTLHHCDLPRLLVEGLGTEPAECFTGRSDYLLLYNDQAEIISLNPDFRKLSKADGRGIIVTAPGTDVDFVSRFFAPQAGIDEDPVTGSAHTTLTPFWSARLGKTSMKARQLSARGGYLECTLRGDRTLISGRAGLFLKGEVFI